MALIGRVIVVIAASGQRKYNLALCQDDVVVEIPSIISSPMTTIITPAVENFKLQRSVCSCCSKHSVLARAAARAVLVLNCSPGNSELIGDYFVLLIVFLFAVDFQNICEWSAATGAPIV